MQAMSGMSGLAGYGFPQLTPAPLYNPVQPPAQPMVPSTSTVVNTVTTQQPQQLSHHIKNEMASSASDESKESSYDMYATESNNDAEACSSTRSNGSPRSQDELVMSSFPGRFLSEVQSVGSGRKVAPHALSLFGYSQLEAGQRWDVMGRILAALFFFRDKKLSMSVVLGPFIQKRRGLLNGQLNTYEYYIKH
ncbi:unnamed protein product [Toxocara canis]|uniref:CNOT2 n=1 Tax=Toxocara canis TaxID=6265 RepID=A0A183UUP7_TOXCA|nr:unnamed protein product [Toxocara canis]